MIRNIFFDMFKKRDLTIFCFIVFLVWSCKLSQRTTPLVHTECDSLYFDLDTGMINAVSPMLSQMDIKEWFTCYTSWTPDGSSKDCGGAVFYNNHGFNYYTFQNYVEVTTKFKGKLSQPLLGISKAQLRTLYQDPKLTAFQKEEYADFDFFQVSYGCLGVKYENDTVKKVSAHFTPCENVLICK